MSKLAVLIPSRNEKYLYPTIRDCFSKAGGEVEVVVTLDGYWPQGWKEMTDAYPNLHTIHHGEARGMRPAINSAAASAIQRGAKYLLKLDAHCMLDEGYDVKLQADMDRDWIVVPRRKRLDAENWVLQDVGKPDIDYHYLSFPDDPNDWGGPGLNGKPWTQRILDRRDKPEFDIDDEMSSQGSAWACHAEYFTQLELMDTDSYGPFWNEFQEVGLKCWLSGGQVKVNKKTWYAHLRKGKEYEGEDGKKGRGYTLPESWLTKGRNQTMNWIWNEAWAKQTLPFKWLIEKFWPVPSWPENWEEVLYATRRPRSIGNLLVHAGTNAGDGSNSFTAKELSVLKIHSAVYGYDDEHKIDVSARVRELVKGGSLDIVVNNSTLVPNENPFRGKKKTLSVQYSFNGGEKILLQRQEKDWLIIGPVQRRPKFVSEPLPNLTIDRDGIKEVAEAESFITDISDKVKAMRREQQGLLDDQVESAKSMVAAGITERDARDIMEEVNRRQGVTVLTDPPHTAAALNDYLIRKFHISPQRLRGPMPIELRDFHRNDLAQLFAELGFKRGAEIGVAEGNYSEVLLKANPECELLLVDPWHHYSDNPQGKSKEKHGYAFNEVMRKTLDYKNVKIMAEYSMDAVRKVEDESLDFFYCDGNHLFDYVVSDLIWWSKKVRSGGLCCGDDFYQLDQKRWAGGGVVEAVQAYVNAHRIPIWYIFQGHKSTDFMWCKP